MLNIRRLGIEDAAVLIAGARGMAQEIGVPMCIAVTDESLHGKRHPEKHAGTWRG